VLTLAVATILFGIIFKVLPDAKIKWKDILPGAFATSLLFLLGKFGISLYIGNSDLGTTYGAAGSLAVIFVWIYYSSIILYFGAEFTKALALNRGATIVPNKYAEWNHEPTVPGAEPKEVPADKKAPLGSSPTPSEREPRPKAKQPAPQLAVSDEQRFYDVAPVRSEPSDEKKGEGPGMGNVLLGLALYFMTRGKEDKPHR
jgi:membrane protein